MAARLGKRSALAVAVLLLAPCLASGAPAHGVHIDAGTPAGREYAVPFGQARSGGAAAGYAPTQLFGSGITLANRSPASARAAAAESSAARHRSPRAATKAHAKKVAAVGAARLSKVLGPARGASGGIWWMLAAAALVLAFGGFTGTALSRRRP